MGLGDLLPDAYLVAVAWRKWFDTGWPPFESIDALCAWNEQWNGLVKLEWSKSCTDQVPRLFDRWATAILGLRDDPKHKPMPSRFLWENADTTVLQELTADRREIARALRMSEPSAGLFVLTGNLRKGELFELIKDWAARSKESVQCATLALPEELRELERDPLCDGVLHAWALLKNRREKVAREVGIRTAGDQHGTQPGGMLCRPKSAASTPLQEVRAVRWSVHKSFIGNGVHYKPGEILELSESDLGHWRNLPKLESTGYLYRLPDEHRREDSVIHRTAETGAKPEAPADWWDDDEQVCQLADEDAATWNAVFQRVHDDDQKAREDCLELAKQADPRTISLDPFPVLTFSFPIDDADYFAKRLEGAAQRRGIVPLHADDGPMWQFGPIRPADFFGVPPDAERAMEVPASVLRTDRTVALSGALAVIHIFRRKVDIHYIGALCLAYLLGVSEDLLPEFPEMHTRLQEQLAAETADGETAPQEGDAKAGDDETTTFKPLDDINNPKHREMVRLFREESWTKGEIAQRYDRTPAWIENLFSLLRNRHGLDVVPKANDPRRGRRNR